MSSKPHLYDLKAETLVDPIGLTEDQPHLTWKLSSGIQTAYQIKVGRTKGEADLWDSGRIEGPAVPYVAYGGVPLSSRQKAHWTVTVWGDFGQVTSSDAHFELGLLSPSEWKAEWIQAPFVGTPDKMSPSPMLRQGFNLDKPVAQARLYITALGLYVAEINGHIIGDEKLAPGWTDYRKRVSYQTFDVSHQLRHGDNAIGVMLGDGWFVGHVAWRQRQFYGDRPRLLARLEVTHPDGTRTDFVSDGSWKVSTGAILEDDLLMGETYDASQEKPGWSSPGFDVSRWDSVEISRVKAPLLIGTYYPPMRVKKELHPISVTEKSNHRYVFDMGQNMVGHVRFKINGKKGQVISLRHAEILKPDGEIYTDNLRKAKAEDTYTFARDGHVEWEPRFTFHGFRYVEVSGLDSKPSLGAITGVVISSDLRETGHFHCSDKLINQLWSNIGWGWRGNSLSVPTDCPQRDERLGWTGDAQVFSPTANFLTDAEGFYAKYTQDLADSQFGDGQIPPIAPDMHINDNEGGPAWSDAFVIVPWEAYKAYGDKRVLERQYLGLRHWIQAQHRTSKERIRSYEGYEGFRGFGDWLNTDEGTPLEIIGTAYFAHCTRIMRDIATVIGKTEDAAEYDQLHREIVAAFRREFLTPQGTLKTATQTACALAVSFELAPEEAYPAIADQIVKDIEKRHWHLSTGFVGTPILMDVLTKLGKLDVAYKLLEQKTWPSWLYPVTRGATTIWERWDGWTEEKGFQDASMNSYNHYAYGAIGAWLYGTVAGIKFNAPTRHLQLAPLPGGTLTSASASYDSVYGKISSEWELKGGHFEWKIEVPANLIADVVFPANCSGWMQDGKNCPAQLKLGPGEYRLFAAYQS